MTVMVTWHSREQTLSLPILLEEQIFNVDEITEVNDVSIEIDSLKRSAVIRYEAVTDEKTYKEEVKIGG